MGCTLVPPDAADTVARAHRALREANRVRLARSVLLRRLGDRSARESCRMAADLVWDVPDVLRSLSVLGLLQHVRRVGGSTAGRICRVCGVPELTALGDLTPRQRTALESALRNRAEFYGSGR